MEYFGAEEFVSLCDFRFTQFYRLEGIEALTLAIPTQQENIMVAIQGTLGGPKLVHAKPIRPIGSSIMTYGRISIQQFVVALLL